MKFASNISHDHIHWNVTKLYLKLLDKAHKLLKVHVFLNQVLFCIIESNYPWSQKLFTNAYNLL